jgi:DNA invertase Pin-like site-specific DNA recombinase
MEKYVAAYVRVSTADQNEMSQRLQIEKWLGGNGIDVAWRRWYVDQASGNGLYRPAFKQLQKDIFVGDIGTVVVSKLDRLSRSLRDGISVLCDWIDRNLRVVSVTQQIDFNGTVGKMIASVILAVAEMEQEVTKERQRDGIDAVKARGAVYKGRKRVKANPQRAAELLARGLSIMEIAKSLDVSRNTVIRYLKSIDPTQEV